MAIVYKNPHQASYDSARTELDTLRQESADLGNRLTWIDQRIAQLEGYLAALQPLLENDPGRDIIDAGLTELCRKLLIRINRWISAQEVREHLASLGVHLDGYTNPMAVLHATLRRVGQVKQDNTGTYYARPDMPADKPVGKGYPAKYEQAMIKGLKK